jgi:quercetin dioxygenase-like cupin family protein
MTSTATTTTAIVRPGQGRRYAAPSPAVPLPAVEIKLDGRNGAPFSVMEYEVPASFAPPPVLHRHTREFGAVYVLEGELTYWFADGVARPATAGTLVVMGRDWFRWANRTPDPARILCLFSPAGFEQFFAELGPLAAGGAPDPEAMGELCARYALDMRPETLPELCARFGVWFPGVE